MGIKGCPNQRNLLYEELIQVSIGMPVVGIGVHHPGPVEVAEATGPAAFQDRCGQIAAELVHGDLQDQAWFLITGHLGAEGEDQEPRVNDSEQVAQRPSHHSGKRPFVTGY